MKHVASLLAAMACAAAAQRLGVRVERGLWGRPAGACIEKYYAEERGMTYVPLILR